LPATGHFPGRPALSDIPTTRSHTDLDRGILLATHLENLGRWCDPQGRFHEPDLSRGDRCAVWPILHEHSSQKHFSIYNEGIIYRTKSPYNVPMSRYR